jgi:hypothetical protein
MAFDGSTPLQVIERGETDRIWRMIYELEFGEPGRGRRQLCNVFKRFGVQGPERRFQSQSRVL